MQQQQQHSEHQLWYIVFIWARKNALISEPLIEVRQTIMKQKQNTQKNKINQRNGGTYNTYTTCSCMRTGKQTVKIVAAFPSGMNDGIRSICHHRTIYIWKMQSKY